MKNIFLHLRMIFLFSSITFSSINISAQTKRVQIKFGDVKPEDFAPTAYAVDSSADAVYLYDGGNSEFQGNDAGGAINFDILFTHHARIRLMKKSSFDEMATVEIPIITEYRNDYVQKVVAFQAAIYSLDNNKISVIKADEKDLLKEDEFERKGRTYTAYKYTFPSVKEGCIIEYSYTVLYPGYSRLGAWQFQGKYPRLWSEYEVTVPTFYSYIISKHGYINYDMDISKETYTDYALKDLNNSMVPYGKLFGASVTTINHLWAIKNAEAIKEEPFITSMNNYITALEFQLYYWQYPEEPKHYYTETWPDFVQTHFFENKDFGKELFDENKWLDEDLDAIASGASDPVDEAKRIYAYVRNNFSVITNNDRPVYLSQTLKKTYTSQQGTSTDINALLIAMLNKRGFDAKPVILSTRGNGRSLETYPDIYQYNYLITKLRINEHDYFLDPSDKNIAFGYIPGKCYNDSARVIDSLPYLVDLSPDSLKEPTISTVFIFNGDNGMEGNFTSILGNFGSEETREKLSEEKQEEFFNNIKKEYLFDVDISNTSLDSLKNPDYPVTIKYDFKYANDSADIIYFNPMLTLAHQENPFASADRFYPVEMPYCFDKIYTLNMEIPKGYTVDELPKSARVSLPDNDAQFEYTIAKSDTNVQLNCRLKFNKAYFDPEDYQALRDFYTYVVKKEAEDIVFKKIK